MLAKTLIALILTACLGLTQTIDRTRPPDTPPIPNYKLPPVYETKLPNGLSVVLVEDARFPIVTLRLGFLAGSKYDPPGLPGLSEITAALLTEGTRTRTSRQLAEELAGIGGVLNGQSGPDGITLAGSALSENTPKLLELLADVALNASFPEDEVKLRIQNRKQELEAQRAEPAFLAEEKFAAVIFGSHPYSHIAPTLASLDRIDRKTLSGFQQQHLAPNNAALILLGKLPPRGQTLELLRARFGSWQKRAVPVAPKPEFPETKRSIELVERPGSVQADIHVGRLAITRAHPDFFPLMVAQSVLGGGASSRMFSEIREKHGFAYDAHAELSPRRDSGFFAAVTQVRNDVFEPALTAVLGELDKMIQAPVGAQELARMQNYLSGLYLLRLETQNGLAAQLINTKLMGLPNEFLEKYTERVRAVTPAQVQEVSRRYMAPEQAAIVVVGDASKIGKPLEKFGPVTVTKAIR